MDLGLDKRMKLRENIRTKEIEEIKKSKRQIFQQYCDQIQMDKQQQQLYFRILNNSFKIFEEHHRYLQLLRESLNWQRVSKFKHLLPEILLALEKYYDEHRYQSEFRSLCLMMLIQCIAMIYFETNVEFDEINKRCLRICFDQFNKNKVQQVHSPLDFEDNGRIRNRCLIAIENITACDHLAIMQQCKKLQILQNLESYVQDFPVPNPVKINILSIYGNLISFHLSYSPEGHWYPDLLKHCIEQNYSPDILCKACEVLNNLLQLENIKNKVQVVMEMECLYFGLVESQIYVEDMQFFILHSLECLMDYEQHKENETGADIFAVLTKIDNIVDNFKIKFAQKIKIDTMPQIFLCLATIYTSVQSSSEHKLQRLTKQLCNFWVDLEDDTSYHFDLYFLKFLRYSLVWASVCYDLYKQYQKGVCEDNAIKASTWEIIEEYLQRISLEKYELAYQFLCILEMPHMSSMIEQPYRESIISKVEGCYYSSSEGADLTKQAEQVLKQYSEIKMELNNFDS